MLAAASDPSASHNCYAWRLSALEARASDDGEPGGTAGRPILAAIEAAGLEGVCVVVTRYYGGTKLGTGGLARAYGGAAAAALAEGERKAVPPMRLGVLEGFESRDLGAVYAALSAHPGADKTSEEEFAEDGTVTLGLAAPVASFDALADALRCATNGRLELRADDAPESSR